MHAKNGAGKVKARSRMESHHEKEKAAGNCQRLKG
jgi:hypothetical protein